MKPRIQTLFITLLWLALAVVAQAQFSYTTNNGTITITHYSGPSGVVIIPATINGYPVTRIQSMSGPYDLTGVVIPNSVVNIGNQAFYGSPNLAGVTFGNSVTNIGNEAFYACGSLANAIIPDSVISIGDAAFNFCGLNSVTIGNSVTGIGNGVFFNCFNLTNFTVNASNLNYSSSNGVLFNKAQTTLVKFPSGLGGNYAIPDGVTSIGEQAFAYVTREDASGTYPFGFLRNVIIPRSVTNIVIGAFYNSSLKSAYFEGNAPPDNGGAFSGVDAIAYYLSGTTGWGSTFGGIPAILWNPQALAISAAAGQFGLVITGPTNATIVVEACTNLSTSAWIPISTNILSSTGVSAFSDLQSSSFPNRYYRFRSP